MMVMMDRVSASLATLAHLLLLHQTSDLVGLLPVAAFGWSMANDLLAQDSTMGAGAELLPLLLVSRLLGGQVSCWSRRWWRWLGDWLTTAADLGLGQISGRVNGHRVIIRVSKQP